MAAQREVDMGRRVIVKHTFLAVQAEEDFEVEEGAMPTRRNSRACTAPSFGGLQPLDFLTSEEEHEETWKASENDLSTPTSSYWSGSPTSPKHRTVSFFVVEDQQVNSMPTASDGQKWNANSVEPPPQPVAQNAFSCAVPVFPALPSPGGMSMGPCIWLLASPASLPSPGLPTSPDSEASSQQQASSQASTEESPKVKKSGKQREPQTKTTLMIRNIPNNLSRELFMALLDEQGFSCCYDFLYLPMDFHRRAGFGYAFINCINSREAKRMLTHFQGFNEWPGSSSHKVCQVLWCSPSQGYHSQVQRFRNNPVMHPSIPDEFKPIVLKDGVRKDFPPPTVSIQPPAHML